MNKSIIIILFILFIINGCKTTVENKKLIRPYHLNISVLLDLSDRIDTIKFSKQPQQYLRDISAVEIIVKYFKEYISQPEKGTFNSNDKLKIYFHPVPNDPEIANIAQKLYIDLEEIDIPEKKKIFKELDSVFTENLKKIYFKTMEEKKYIGSDIWRFMKDEVMMKCIEKDTTFRNILIIITDGYIYWEHNKLNLNNRFNYITGAFSHFNQFRDPILLSSKFDNDDYGFIKVQENLDNLEILVLEVSPPIEYPQDFDIIKKYWTKWFDEMRVKKYDIEKTDLPINTKNNIYYFLRDK
jgi:hypothetical protein